MIGLCPGLVIFTTCCQAPSGSARSGSTATRTSAPGTLRAAASVTLTAIAVRAGVHASAVRRYYSSREEILLTLAEEGYRDWAHDIATRLSGRQEVTSGELARILTASLAERQLFCDLLTHVTLSLEREVTFERVHAVAGRPPRRNPHPPVCRRARHGPHRHRLRTHPHPPDHSPDRRHDPRVISWLRSGSGGFTQAGLAEIMGADLTGTLILFS